MSDTRALVLELLSETLSEWREIVARDPLGRFDARAMTKPWVAGLKSAGVADAHQPKLGSRDGWAVLPFVIEFSCPFWHRTIDRQRIGLVRLIVEDDGWVTMAPGELDPKTEAAPRNSPFCWECQPDALSEWLVTCPRCRSGDVSEDHHAGHGLDSIESTAPFSFVLFEFDRAMHVAEAAWVVAHTEQAVDEWLGGFWAETDLALAGIEFEPDENGDIPREVARRWVLDQVADYLPKPRATKAVTSGSPKPSWTDAEVVAFLEHAGLAADATIREAWAVVGPMPQPRPPKARIEDVQPKRKIA